MPTTAPLTQTPVLISLSLPLTHTLTQLAVGLRSDPWAFVEGGVYEYLQFNTTHQHKNTLAPEQNWR